MFTSAENIFCITADHYCYLSFLNYFLNPFLKLFFEIIFWNYFLFQILKKAQSQEIYPSFYPKKNISWKWSKIANYYTTLFKVVLWSKTHFLFFVLKAYSLNIQLAKFWALCFIRKLFILSVSFGFDGPPLLTFKTDR